ncbi:corrinoid protein [Candidatus Borrarchaeum sp.]|uniref:cobalamin B12-binding domain-containing protein n=1 Tax=Candidatus Borrarchaeum sp. TaxID=2846742 RepID=UPI00257E057E|nr:corrinoid protein [Candidatus Borrarchaeum sp.]
MEKKNPELCEKIKQAIIDVDPEPAKKIVEEALKSMDPLEIINCMTEGMAEVGRLYEERYYFVTELLIAGEIMSQNIDVIKPYLAEGETPTAHGKIVFGTVKDDIHDIGKSIMISLLKVAGFEVVDLGVDVPASKFIETLKETNADILAMSSLLTSTVDQIKNVIAELKKEGLRDQVKVIIGGAAITEDFAKEVEVDGYAVDATQGVNKCKALLQ